MPLTIQDLQLWEKQGDADKFRQILMYLTEEQYTDLRIYAVKALGRIRNPKGIIYLVGLEDRESVVDCAVEQVKCWIAEDVDTFCEIVEDSTVPTQYRRGILTAILDYPCERVAETIIKLLSRYEFVDKIQNATKELPIFIFLKPKLEHPEAIIRYSALLALEEICDRPEVFSCVLSALDDVDPQIRCLAAELLASVTNKKESIVEIETIVLLEKAIESLVNHLSDDDFMVRTKSAKALEPLSDHRAKHNLKLLLADPYISVRMRSVEALSRIPDKRLFKRFVHMYQNETNVELRKCLIEAAAFTGHKDSLEFLKAIITTSDEAGLKIKAMQSCMMTQEKQSAIDLLTTQLSINSAYIIETVLRIFWRADIIPPVEVLNSLLDHYFEILDDRAIRLIFRMFYQLNDQRSIESLMGALEKSEDKDLDESIISLIEEIIKPTILQDYLINLPSTQDGIYRKSIEKIKNYLQENKGA